jgi:hypothetical protein
MTITTDFHISCDPGEPFPEYDEELERFLDEIHGAGSCLDDPEWVEMEQQKSQRVFETYGFNL